MTDRLRSGATLSLHSPALPRLPSRGINTVSLCIWHNMSSKTLSKTLATECANNASVLEFPPGQQIVVSFQRHVDLA